MHAGIAFNTSWPTKLDAGPIRKWAAKRDLVSFPYELGPAPGGSAFRVGCRRLAAQ